METESPQQYQERLRRSREEQIAAQERREKEAVARRAQIEINRERGQIIRSTVGRLGSHSIKNA